MCTQTQFQMQYLIDNGNYIRNPPPKKSKQAKPSRELKWLNEDFKEVSFGRVVMGLGISKGVESFGLVVLMNPGT